MFAFGKLNPLASTVYFIAVLLIAMFVNNPVIQSTALIGGFLFCAILQGKRRMLKDISLYVPLLLIIAFTNPLFSHNGVTPLFFLNGNAVTAEAVLYGFGIGVMIISVAIWCKCFSFVLTSDKLLYLFGRVIPKLSLVLSMSLRFIPMLIRQAKKVSRAQKAMGLYASDSFSDRIRAALRVFGTVIGWAFENSLDTSASMKSRGYGLKGRTNFSLFRFTAKDGVMLCITLILLSFCIAGTAMEVTEFSYYPSIGEIDTSVHAMSVYAAYGVLVLIPFIIEVKEALSWKYCVSRI